VPAATASARRIRLIVLFAFLLLLGAIAFSRFSVYHDLTGLRDRGAEAEGAVTKVDTAKHTLSYSFVVFGRTYTGSDTVTPGDGSPPLAGLASGSAVAVIFDPADPGKSVVGNPEARIVSLEAGIAISVGVVFVVGLIGLYLYFFTGGRRGVSAWR
jgi:hypothetical protein